MKNLKCAFFCGALCLAPFGLKAASVTIVGQTAGPSPFISDLQLSASPPDSIQSIKFEITPKPGSVTRPLSVTYSSEYLQRRGYYNTQSGAILLPVFGLYADYTNTVTLIYTFTDNSSQPDGLMITTAVFNDPCSYTNPTVVQARTSSTTLSYDYIFIRNVCGDSAPIIIDTDGEVRWAGTTGFANNLPATLFQNSIYITDGPLIYRMEFDGTFVVLRDYGPDGVDKFHHNIDRGKRGIILDADTPAQAEATNIEVDGLGNILKIWNLADIISAAMTAGGDDPTQFIQPSPNDWFHNNSVTYKQSDDSLLVSSRENFVIALDYESGAIKWILGDDTKQWYLFQSLRNFALTLGANTLPPIGEHALSITADDDLLLFDNGQSSLNHIPTGADRTYSAPRKYHIDAQANVATELWNYEAGQAFYSPFCSSIYEDAPLNYLVDYAILGTSPNQLAEILGLDASGTKIFHYRYPESSCDTAYNSFPIHLEDLVLSTIPSPTAVSRKDHGGLGSFDIPLPLTGTPGIECRSGGANGDYQVVLTFASPVIITNATSTPDNGGTADVSGASIVDGNEVTVNLTNVSNAQTLTVTLNGVNDGAHTENISVPVTVLIGDVTGNQLVNSSDISEVKLRSGQMVNNANFKSDLDVNGAINSSDISLVKLKSGAETMFRATRH